MKKQIKKMVSAALAAVMLSGLPALSAVSYAETNTVTVVDDNFDSTPNSGVTSPWGTVKGWGNSKISVEDREENNKCLKWTSNGNNAGAWEQIFVNMTALKETDTLNISYDFMIGDNFNTKAGIMLDGGTDSQEYIWFGENLSGNGELHIGTDKAIDASGKYTHINTTIEKNKWNTASISIKDSKTTISLNGTKICENITPPEGATFNQEGVSKIRFLADGVDNANSKNVYIDNVKITVQSEASTPVTPVTPTDGVLLSENFDSYEVGKKVTETLVNDGTNWKTFYADDSVIVEGENGYGKALKIIDMWDNAGQISYKNLKIGKKYAIINTMIKPETGCNFDIKISDSTAAQETYYNIAHIDNLKISGTELENEWYKYTAVIDTDAWTADWALTDLNGAAVAVGTFDNLGNVKSFDTFGLCNWNKNVPVCVDEVMIKETDEKLTLPKLPPKTTLFEQNFDYEIGAKFKDVKGDANWTMYYTDNSEIVTGADGHGNALAMKDMSDSPENISWSYKNISPELNNIEFSIMFNTPADTNFDIQMAYSSADGSGSSYANIINIQNLKLTGTDKTINADAWYRLTADIDRKTGKTAYKITDLSNNNIYENTTTIAGAKRFSGFSMVSYGAKGQKKDILFDEIKVTQSCGTPSLESDGVEFYKGSEKETDMNAISSVIDKIVLKFNTYMNLKSLTDNIKIKDADNRDVNYTGELLDNVFTMKLNDVLKTSTKYTIEIGSGVQAYTGESLAQALNEKFTTAAGEMSGKIKAVSIDDAKVTETSQLIKGKKMNITIDYVNTLNDTDLNGYVIVAYYSGNKLIKADYGTKIERKASVKKDTITLDRPVPDFGADAPTSAKLMFWNGLDKMMPITDAYPIGE